MKKVLIFIIAIVLVGCTTEPLKMQGTSSLYDPEIVVIDSCEYIQFGTMNKYSNITHKGNCVYCEKRLEKLIRKYQNK
ncbi:MAG: hypothetical protein EHM12_08055 [Dehalococcoidia bacterium]|nr:MAG: hypothetical protein EHM12_08055 [Dehalococcoidia bacterium]